MAIRPGRGEIVGKSLRLVCHSKNRFGGFPQLTLQNPVDLSKLVRRQDHMTEGRSVAEIRVFRKQLMIAADESNQSHRRRSIPFCNAYGV